jgi:hypothetical protein
VARGGAQQGEHFFAAEDVRHEHRLPDRRHGVLGNKAARVAATAEQAQLAHDAELLAHRDGLAPLDPRRPSRHDLLQRSTVLTVLIADESDEAVEHEPGTHVAHAHGALERQELGHVADQDCGTHLRTHRGTGSETSRSECVAMRT